MSSCCVVEGCGGSAHVVSERGIGGSTCSSAGDRRYCFPHCIGGGGGQDARFCRRNSGIDGGTGDQRYVPSAAPGRRAVVARDSSAGAASSDAAAEAAPSTGDTAARDASVERAAKSSRQQLDPLAKSAARGGRPPTPLIQVQCFHWRSATTKSAGCSMAVAAVVRVTAAAATATTTPVTTTHGGIQPVLEHCCDPLIRGNDAGGVRG